MKLGIVGYSSGKFDQEVALSMIAVGIATAEAESKTLATELVSGLTDQGVPGLAYHLAASMDLKTVGIACSKASEYPCFPVDEEIIVGDDWGDESQTFLERVDAIVRVGGGEQSLKEVALFREQKPDAIVVEFELPRESE
jgi:hypothetical protein